MAERDQVGLLLRELGQRLGLADLDLDEDGHAALAFDDVLVDFEFDAAQEGRLLLYAYLGEPQGGEPAALLRAMLEANFFWRGTGGATLSLERATGGAVLALPVAIAGLDYGTFERTLEGFVAAAETWMKRLAAAAAEPAAATEVRAPGGPEMIFRA